VRVFVRCRPFLRCDGEETAEAKPCLNFHPEGNSLSLVGTAGRGAGQSFSFDQVLSTTATQQDVYAGISDLVQSALDGYRVCVFSYGQTGSGKTHTMTGDSKDEGIIPRSVRHILSHAMTLQESEPWKISVSASIVELYNEEVKDLLGAGANDSHDKLKISFANGRVSVNGLVTEQIELTNLDSGMYHLNRLLQQASKARTTACTGMNERSSRSHVLFMLDVTCVHESGTVMQGGLKLVDLAGSERLDRTGTLNDAVRLKETVNINKSLSSLQDVFTALSKKQSHVPYRNSKLTLLLQVREKY
jgi:kinesin family member C1